MQQDPERSRLHEKIAVQQQHAQALKAELQRLLSLVEQVDAEKAGKRARTVGCQTATERSRRPHHTGATEQLRISSELRHLQQRLARGRHTLASLQQAADDKTQSLRKLRQRLSLETRKLDDIRTEGA